MKQLLNSPVRKDILFLLAACALVFLLNTWGYPLFDVDEPRYAETAREMLLNNPGDWITPHFNWIERFDKPPLFYWLIAGSYKLFGVSEFAARLISVLAASFLVFMIYFVVKQALQNRKIALVSGLCFLTMAEVYGLGRWSVTDMTLSACMGATWLALFLAITHSPRWLVAAGIAGGLGLLAKGPVAVALPGLTFLLYGAFFNRNTFKLFLSKWALLGLVACLAVALPWYNAVNQANPGQFIQEFFLKHNVERFSSTVSGHKGPIWYYIPVLLLGTLPWTWAFPWVFKECKANWKSLNPLIQYSLIWAILVFVFFSVAGTKLLTYILPEFAAIAILIGYGLSQKHHLALKVASISIIVMALFNLMGFPAIAQIAQADIVRYAKRAQADGIPLVTCQIKKPSLVFYNQNPIGYMELNPTQVDKLHHSATQSSAKGRFYVVIKTRLIDSLKEHYAVTLVDSGKKYSLVAVENPQLIQGANQ